MTTDHSSYITTYFGGSGYFAVLLGYYEDIKGYDITQTGIGRYKTLDEAIEEAKNWAEAEELEYRIAKQ